MAVNLSPVGGVAAQFFTNTGAVLTGGKIYTYLAGTTTPATTYTTSTGNVPWTNPIVLDAAGRVPSSGEIWLTIGVTYKFLLKDSNDVLIGTYDNVSSTPNIDSSLVTYTPAGTGAVTTTVQAKLRQVVSVQDFGAVADGNISTGAGTNNSPMFQAAINALGAGGCLYIPAGKYVLASQVTVPSDFTITGAGMYQTFLIAPTAFNSDGLLKLNGAGGPPTNISDLCVGGQVGGAGASSIGINSVANGAFLRNLWLTGFKVNVNLANSDNFLLNSASETTVSSGIGIQITNTDVTVANCVTYDCYVGLAVTNAAYVDGTVTLSNIRSLACSYDGFAFTSSSNIQMSNCSVGHNNAGRYLHSAVHIDTCSNVNISNFIGRLGNTSSVAWGIRTINSSVINISNSQLSNWLYGIFVTNGNQVAINGNTCSNNYSRGIYVLGADQVVIGNNCCNVDGNVGVTDAGIYSDNTSAFALHNITGNMCSQGGGGVQEYGIYADVTNNGASSGFTNIVGNICKFNATANISTNGVTANISSTGNVV
jgi:parallel beta-helix repeat protein